MSTPLQQPRGSTMVETNKMSISRLFGTTHDKVTYLEVGVEISDFEIFYDKNTETCFKNPDGTGTIISWSISNTVLTLSTTTGTYVIDKALYNSEIIGWDRSKLKNSNIYGNSISYMLDSQWVSIMEFESYITSKPDSTDFETWDWYPAINAAIEYVKSYVSQTAVNANMYGVMPIVFPPGVYKYSSELIFPKYMNSTGSLSTCYTLIGSGMTSTVLQPTTEGMNAFTATECKLNLQDIGFRSGALYQTGGVLGSKTEWKPVIHSNWSRVGFSGFAQGVLANLVFDSTFEDLFIQNISSMKTTTDNSYGFSFETYTGPANGGTAGDGTGDDSNQITFIRPTIETSNADNSILFNFSGLSASLPHHAINIYSGHIETHNLKAKCYNIKNCFNINFYGTIFSQNGNSVDTVYRLGYIESSYNINFTNCRQVTTARLLAYATTDTLSIKITGSSNNICFNNNHFVNPYYNLSTYNRGSTYNIDSSEATKTINSYKIYDCTFNTYTNRSTSTRYTITNADVNNKNHILSVNSSGDLEFNYSSSSDYSTSDVNLLSLSSSGNIKSVSNLQIGTLSSAATTRVIDFMSAGNTTSMARISVDSTGRLYIRSVNGSQEWVFGSSAISPSTTAAYDIGSSSATVRNIYTQNAVTVVSDENHKSDIQDIPDELLDAWGTINFQMWKMNAAVAIKGEEDARWHVGYIAQQVRDALIAAGLDWTKYGLITYESWPAVSETYDENGVQLTDAVEAGEIYMLRMEECLIVESAYQRREIKNIKLLLNSSKSNSTGNDESTS